jgi:flagellar hook assembly protein FlgD
VFIDRNLSNDLVTSLSELRPDFGERSLAIYPNPVSGQATLVYEIPSAGRVDVSVWNLSGQRVSNLFSGRQGPGRHEVRWDVRGGKGSRMPSGQYIVTVDVEGRRMQRRFLVQ